MGLRPYQTALLGAIRADLRRQRAEGRAVPATLAQLPTGGGKTHIIVAICEAARERVLVGVHREELWRQARERLQDHGVRTGVFVSGHDDDHDAPVLVAGVQTIIARGYVPDDIGIAIPDEAHHAVAATWRRVLGSCGPSLRAIVGLTATPARYDGSALRDVFGGLVVGPSIQELQALPVPALCALRVLRPPARRDTLSRDPLDVLLEHRERPSVVFCGTVGESKALAERACAAGIRLLHVDGNTKGRDALLARLGADFDGVTNADVLTEGWDWPACSLCVLACPIGSVTRLLQRVGRVARPSPGKVDGLVYDLMGCTYDLGVPGIDDYHWSLDDESGRVVRRAVTVATCRACHAAYPYQPVCPRCGSRNPPPPARRVAWADLSEATREAVYSRRDPVEWLARTMVAARERGWKRGAVEMRFAGWAKRAPTAEEIAAARVAVSGGRG